MDVLLASTHVFRLELSAYVLSEAGYRVREFTRSEGLLQELTHCLPDLLILDLQLLSEPELNELRSYTSSVQLPLLLMRANSAQALALAPNEEIVQWPYQQADFLAQVQALMPLGDEVIA